MLPLQHHFPEASQIVYGCMGLGGGWDNAPVTAEHVNQAHQIIDKCIENGINIFDHADIYTFNKAEIAFGQALQSAPDLREQMVLQSKCGIRFADEDGPKRYDFSAQWLHHSVRGILSRLQVEQIDILLLHRPDPLMELAETAQALNHMNQQGMFKAVGVSNMSVPQIEFLAGALVMPLVVNQVECGLHHLSLIDQQVVGNDSGYSPYNTFTGLLEYAQQKPLQLQAWGSMSQGRYTRPANPHEEAISQELTRLAEAYDTSIEAIQLAFLTRHPVNIQPVIGTTNLNRIDECSKLANIILSRGDWYSLLETARNGELP